MKIIKILYQIILILMLIIIVNTSICYAAPFEENAFGGEEGSSTFVTGDDENGLPDIHNGYKPSVQLGGAKSIVEKILGVLTVLGVIFIVVSIALIGFNIILGTASEKAVNQEKLIGILIAAAVLTGGSSLAQIIMKFAESI